MNTRSWMSAAMAGVIAFSGIAQAQDEEEKKPLDLDLIINAMPASILISTSGDKFKATDGDGSTTSMSQIFTMPNLLVGLGMDVGDGWYVDATVGPGIIINDNFRSVFFQGVLAANYLVSDSFQLGPRVGIIQHIDPEWTEDDTVEFDDSTGYLVGIWAGMGERVKYWISVDVLATEFDTTTNSGTTTNSDDKFELNGLAVQFGVRGEF